MLFIGAEEAGRLSVLSVTEGQEVRPGDLLFTVDQTTQVADYEAAKAALAEAQAKLARVEAAQQRPEEIAVLEATRNQAQAALDYSTVDLERARQLVARGFSPQSRLDQAQSVYDRDKATLETVKRQIEVAHLSGRIEDLNQARHAVDQAQAQMNSAQARMKRLDVKSTATGRIQQIYYRTGEVVPMGRPVVSLLPPGNIKVRFFVPQAQYPKIKIGQEIHVTCDGCKPNIIAHISFLSAQAEYTPPVIYSMEEREKLVFLVEARPVDAELLRTGQPVSVVLELTQN